MSVLAYARRQGRESVAWYGGLGLLALRVTRNLRLPPSYLILVAREIDVIGVRSLVVAVTASLFTGMVLALQTAVNMARFGAENYVGPVVALSILRELGPVLTAILVGGKVASGITAELGSMKVTEQIDALRAIGVNYVKKLIVPRLLAALLVFPLVTVMADAVGPRGRNARRRLRPQRRPVPLLEHHLLLGGHEGLPDRSRQERGLRRARHPHRLLQRPRDRAAGRKGSAAPRPTPWCRWPWR